LELTNLNTVSADVKLGEVLLRLGDVILVDASDLNRATLDRFDKRWFVLQTAVSGVFETSEQFTVFITKCVEPTHRLSPSAFVDREIIS